ncbi:Protein-tyrosine phosphatase containing protein [Aphelenchoides besseyi]|nr:Protein-tyrosine phosphatase containing protein [Aphelenchoides besseyi]
MDTVQCKDGSMQALNRSSHRSNRRGKSKFGHPILLIQHLTDNNKRSIGDGLNNAFNQLIRESPTLFNFLNPKNVGRNRFPDQIFLYDFSRVVLNGPSDYYHASYVDGYKQTKEYVLAQAPYNSATEIDFHRLVAQLKPDIVVVLMKTGTAECNLMFPVGKKKSKTKGDITIKVEDEGTQEKFEWSSIEITTNKTETLKTNVCYFSTWIEETKVPVNDMADFLNLVLLDQKPQEDSRSIETGDLSVWSMAFGSLGGLRNGM